VGWWRSEREKPTQFRSHGGLESQSRWRGELRIYEGMAEAYRAYCSGKILTPQAKQEVFQVVLLRSGAPDSEVLTRLELKVLSMQDAREILKHYNVAPAPVVVSRKPRDK